MLTMDTHASSQFSGGPVAPKKKRSKIKIALMITGALLLLAAAAAGVYVYTAQQSRNEALSAELEDNKNQIASLKTRIANQAAELKKQQQIAPEDDGLPALIPGDTDTRRDDGRIFIAPLFKYSLEPSAVWIEYGTSPEMLDEASEKVTSELGEGVVDAEDDAYATGVAVAISEENLEPDTLYYYRVGATAGGVTHYSALASFVTDK